MEGHMTLKQYASPTFFEVGVINITNLLSADFVQRVVKILTITMQKSSSVQNEVKYFLNP